MLRFGEHSIQKSMLSKWFPAPLVADFGSRVTRISSLGQIVFQDQTCVVYRVADQSVIAIGQSAASYRGRLPEGMKLAWPIRHGVISDVLAASLFFKTVFKQVRSKSSNWLLPIISQFIPQPIVVTVRSSFSPVQKHLYQRILVEEHLRPTFLIKGTALFSALLNKKTEQFVWCVIDIGAMDTEIAVWAQNEILMEKTIEIGGDDFTEKILTQTKKKYQAEIGWQTAEKIKFNLCCLGSKEGGSAKFTIRARSLSTSLPTSLLLSSDSYKDAFQEVSSEWIWQVKEALHRLSPELISQLLENGILFTGGGSQLPGLSELLALELQTDVLNSQHPDTDLIRGATLT